MGRRGRRRARDSGGTQAASTTEYRDDQGNVLVLRDALSSGTLRELQTAESRPGASAEDRDARRAELLFERLAVSWEIAGLPLETQKELLGRYRLASAEERAWLRRTIAEHLHERHPDLQV